jgi:hypothetical protein
VEANCGLLSKIMPRPSPFTSFSIHYSKRYSK